MRGRDQFKKNPLTRDFPKSLLDVGGKTILDW